MKCPESQKYSRMNVQKEEVAGNGCQSPFYVDDDNGNNNLTEGDNLSKGECDVNVGGQGLGGFDGSFLHSLQDASSSYSLPSSHALEVEDTMDYISKAVEDGSSPEKSAIQESSKSSRLHANTIECDTVDYIHQEPSQHQTGSMISSPAQMQTCPQSGILTGPDHFQYMHNKHNLNVGQPVPYVQVSTDECFGNTQFSRTSQFTLKQADEARGNISSDRVGLCTMFDKTERTETANNDSALNTNSLYFSWDLSDECLRKSFVSSGSEKPRSTSLLEASGLHNASTDVFSESVKWTDGEPDGCPGSGQSKKDLNYFEVPQHNDSKEREKMNSSSTPEPGVLPVDPSAVHLEDFACKSNGNLDNNPLRLTDKEDIGMKKKEACEGVSTSEPVITVFQVDVDLETKDITDLNSTSSHGLKSPRSNLLSNFSGPSCEDTFLIVSPNSSNQTQTSTPIPESKNITFAVPELDVFTDGNKRKTSVESESEPKVNGLDVLKAGPVGGTLKAANRKLPGAAPVPKVKKSDVISFPKPNFKNVKAKVLTRPALQIKDGAPSSSKPSPSLSNASSPVVSPRTAASAVGTLRKKSLQEPSLKAEAAIAKSQKQPINKQLFPSQVAHVPTHSKHASGKVPRTAVLKQTQDELDRASSSNSTRSSGSAAAVTCTAASRPTEKGRTVSQRTPSMAPMGPDKIKQNGIVDPSYDQADSQNGNCIPGDILTNIVPLATPVKNLNKNLLSCLRNSAVQPVCSAKTRILPTTQRPGSTGRNVVTVRVSSPPKVSLQAVIDRGLGSPKRKSISVTTSASIGTRSLPRSRVPIRGPTLTRTSSVSSVCSIRSEQSTLSSRSTTTSNKTEEVPAKCMRQNGGPCAQPSKMTFSRGRSQSLKVTTTVVKKSPSSVPGVTKSAVSSVPVTRRVEYKTCNAGSHNKKKN
uniref:Microtubule-associated tumor suppressor 1 n=1 Tax=Leptobrachium leishanense TaxID=445787 RepID=A0A8C5LSU1_9ANUR